MTKDEAGSMRKDDTDTLDVPRTRTDALLVELFGHRAFLIGGPVRDMLRHRFHGDPVDLKDRDYVVVGASFREVTEALAPHARVDAVGASFGVLKVTVPGEETVDVALPRRERSTGVGHRDFEVQSGPEVTIDEDQERRDFRMNAVGVQLSTGRLAAFPGAVEDIRARRIVAIAGRRSFEDDPLRILRGAQFAARFGFDVEPATLEHMRACAPLVASVSPERIAEEMTKLLTRSRTPSRGIRILRAAGALPHVAPGLAECAGVEQNDFHAYDVLDHVLAATDLARPTAEARWAALLHDVGKPATRSREKVGHGYAFHGHEEVGAVMAKAILSRLRYPNAFVDRVVRLVRHHMYAPDPALSDAAVRRFVNRAGPDLLEALFHLRECDKKGSGMPWEEGMARNAAFEARVHAILAARPALTIADLAVDGNDALEALAAASGRPAREMRGPAVGRMLAALRDLVVEDPGLNNRQRLLELLTLTAEARSDVDMGPTGP